MLSPKKVSDLIRDTALAQIPDSTYLRATDAEANIAADHIDLDAQVFVLYSNFPEVDHDLSETGASELTTWPVEIRLLCIADMDDDSQDADDIQDPLYLHAKNLFNKIQAQLTEPEYVVSYTIELGETVKIYDKVMTGVTLVFDLLSNEGMSC